MSTISSPPTTSVKSKKSLHSKRKADSLVNAHTRASKTKIGQGLTAVETFDDLDVNTYRELEWNGCLSNDGYNESDTESHQFLEKMFKFLLQRAKQNIKRESKVLRFAEPEEIKNAIDIEIRKDGVSDDVLLEEAEKVLDYSVNTSHPHFFNQLFAGADEYSIAGACVTEVVNSSAYTYEMAPVFSVQERYVFSKMISSIGWEDGDAIFCPGGSMSNMYAINLARHSRFPDIKTKGLHCVPQLVVFTSEHCHYSLKKGMSFLGFGSDNLVSVKCDSRGCMIPAELEKEIELVKSEGKFPLMVNATCGTTVFGAYDPVDEIADVCEKHGIWLHMDGAWGGSVLLSKTHRHKMNGSHRGDSMTWNPHKLLGVSLQCSAFLTRHKNLLKPTFSANASYLFQQDKFYDVSYDTGDASLQCGRKVDIFKFWLMWKKYGDEGMEKKVDKAFHNAHYLAEKVRTTPGFELVFEPQCTNVGFWYVPPSLRGKQQEPDYEERLSRVAPKIKERMMKDGTMMINYQPCGNLVNFFRMIIINHIVTERDMDFVIEEIIRLGSDL